MTTLGIFMQVGLALAFLTASLRLFWTATHGRQNIRYFRTFGGVLTLAWAVFNVFSVVNFHSVQNGDPIAAVETQANIARSLQYFNAVAFLAWGFLFHESAFDEECDKKLTKLYNEMKGED